MNRQSDPCQRRNHFTFLHFSPFSSNGLPQNLHCLLHRFPSTCCVTARLQLIHCPGCERLKLAIATIFSSPAKSKGSTHPAFPLLVTPHTVCPDFPLFATHSVSCMQASLCSQAACYIMPLLHLTIPIACYYMCVAPSIPTACYLVCWAATGFPAGCAAK